MACGWCTANLTDCRALLLIGDGRGGFAARDGTSSGLLVYGDQRGGAAADVDGDGRTDLAIAQNGAATRLFLNRAAVPGIRVSLQGPPANPWGVGARIRFRVGDRSTPWRQIQAGNGYWSVTSPSVVLGRPERGAGRIEVRWPDGRTTTHPASAGATAVTLRPEPK